MTRLWIVRAGRNGERELDVISQSRLMVEFNEVGDLSTLKTRDEILAAVLAGGLTTSENQARNYAAQLNQFVNAIALGDLVVLPRKQTSGVAIGEVTGPYLYVADAPSPHMRPVKWLKESVPRTAFGQDLRYSFGAFMTICEIRRNEALARVQAVVASGAGPGPLLGKQGKIAAKAPIDDLDAEDADQDIEDAAQQQIIAMIRSTFAGHALADLIAEILRTEGYVTKVSPPGPDGGVDILAAGGRLGLGEDRVCVQVKSGDGQADNGVVLKLVGSMQTCQARTGLLVSIGGVSSAAAKLIENQFFTLRLWQMDDLLKALYRAYGQLSPETRAKLPLKQVWAPAIVEG